MKFKKVLGGLVFGALAASSIPYFVKKDEETGALEVRSLLWGFRKTPGKTEEERDRYEFAIPPSGLDDEEPEDAAEPEEAEEPEETREEAEEAEAPEEAEESKEDEETQE